uniref:Galectin n=1 Tax=Heterorhabditis bacteriophora TaxID=37862 RepID=A0A1I7WC78_HETBA
MSIGSGVMSIQFGTELFNPQTPVEIPIRGFTNGERIRVVLIPNDKKDQRFHINLRSGSDIIIHFNPRLKDKMIVFNSLLNGSWQKERTLGVNFPFKKNNIYTIEFIASYHNSVTCQSGYKITTLEISGDVHVHSVHTTI